MSEKIEYGHQLQTFEYPLLRRLPLILLLGMFICSSLVILAIVLLSLANLVVGQKFPEGMEGPDDLGTFLVSILAPFFFLYGGLSLNLMFPAVHIKPDGFRVSRLFYTSPWFDWQDIHIIKKPPPAIWGRSFGITVQGLPHKFYSFTGAFVLSESKAGFVVADRIENYKELVQFFQYHRPDLFEGPGKKIIEELNDF